MSARRDEPGYAAACMALLHLAESEGMPLDNMPSGKIVNVVLDAYEAAGALRESVSPRPPSEARIEAVARAFAVEQGDQWESLDREERESARRSAVFVLEAADAVGVSPPSALDALRETEWAEVFSDYKVGDFICGACGNTRDHGHEHGCSVAIALRAASVPLVTPSDPK